MISQPPIDNAYVAKGCELFSQSDKYKTALENIAKWETPYHAKMAKHTVDTIKRYAEMVLSGETKGEN